MSDFVATIIDVGYILLVIAVRLAVQLVEHRRD